MIVKPVSAGIAALLLAIIRTYQLTLSFLFGRSCRHLPTCSDYAMDAIRKHGPWAGFWLAAFRFARCNPWGTSGFDPVPGQVPAAGLKVWKYAAFRPVDNKTASLHGREAESPNPCKTIGDQ
jgi:putative membrane protein insertion efficiency factor